MTSFDIGSGGLARAVFLLLSCVAMSACGGDSTTEPPDGGTKERWVTAVSRSWTVPEETESYVCHTELATSDKYYTGFRLASPPAAQTERLLTVRPAVTQVDDFDCGFASIAGGELIYVAGPGTTPVTFSGGKGVHVAAGQYVMLVEHLNNTSASPVTATTTVEGRVGAAQDVTIPIDMFFAGALQLAIGDDSVPHTEDGGCPRAADVHVVAEIPVMRSLGIHQTLSVTDISQHVTNVIFDSSFDPRHLVFTSLATDLLLPGVSEILASCTYVNTTGFVVHEGESASDELCLLGIFRYPPKPPTSITPYECPMGEII